VQHWHERQAQVKLAIVNTEARSWDFWKGQASYMRRRGIEYHCISSGGPLLDQFAKREHVIVHAVEVTRSITPWRDLCTVFLLAAKLREIGAHIVQGDTSKSGMLAMIAGWLARVPVRIYRNHGMALSSARGPRRILLWWCEKITCLLAHEVIYVAPSVRQAAIAEGVCPPSKARTVLSANGLDAVNRFNPANLELGARDKARERWGIPTEALVLGFVGRLFRVKGIIELVQAWETLAEIYPNLHLLLAGEFDTRDPVPKSVEKQLRNDTRIHLAGYVDDTPQLYGAMDVLILPSFHEGLGYALIEASAMEVPVIGTRIPGIVDAIRDGMTGRLIEPRSVAAIIESVRRYLDDPGLRRRHGQAGRQYVVDTFQQGRVWADLYEHYRTLSRTQGLPVAAAVSKALGQHPPGNGCTRAAGVADSATGT
jgi:glycosyltransferase involved in cell wall biosynthesis